MWEIFTSLATLLLFRDHLVSKSHCYQAKCKLTSDITRMSKDFEWKPEIRIEGMLLVIQTLSNVRYKIRKY